MGTAVAWTAGFAVLALLPAALVPFEPAAARPIVSTWTGLAAVLGVYASLEAWVLRDNPLLGWAYRSAPAPDGFDQIWSVYRATTTMGHPLVNATFFAVALPLAVDRACATGGRWTSPRSPRPGRACWPPAAAVRWWPGRWRRR